MCVASPLYISGPFWEQLGTYRLVRRLCGNRELPFFVEDTRTDCVHACTVADIVTVLNQIPGQDYRRLAAVVLRQPKRRETILHPVWGRMAYWADIGRPQAGAVAGPVVMLEAQVPNRVWWLKGSMGPAVAAEIERLAADGHLMVPTRNRIRIESTLAAIRATQLYRTLLHEIGHLVDYESKVPEDDESKGISLDRHIELAEKFWQRPSQEREAFAHRYADRLQARLIASGHIPFARIESWTSDGFRACDFTWPPEQIPFCDTAPPDPL